MSDSVWQALIEALADGGVPDPHAALETLASCGVEVNDLSPGQVVDVVLSSPDSPLFGRGSYHGTYDGIPNCWFSSDGKVYAPDGSCVGGY